LGGSKKGRLSGLRFFFTKIIFTISLAEIKIEISLHSVYGTQFRKIMGV
jgi:hypothetical protein